MEHRGIEYTVVQGIDRGLWKWSTSVADVVVMGQAPSKVAVGFDAISVVSDARGPVPSPKAPIPGRRLGRLQSAEAEWPDQRQRGCSCRPAGARLRRNFDCAGPGHRRGRDQLRVAATLRIVARAEVVKQNSSLPHDRDNYGY
jgi:hypothetical protein